MSNDTQSRVVVWEPFSTYLTLNALAAVPFIVPALMWMLAYFQPVTINHSHVAAGIARLWYHSNTLVDRFVLVPYYEHSGLTLFACVMLTLVPAAHYYYRTREARPFFLLTPSLSVWATPFIVSLLTFQATARHSTWFEITFLLCSAFFAFRYWTRRLKTLGPNTLRGDD
jgi:hypothetical protein